MRYALLLFLIGCGNPNVNECATPGATYLMHFVQDTTGTCGNIPDEVVNNGGASGFVCEHVETTGCTTKKTNCTKSGNQCELLGSTITYSADGQTATGLETLACGSCASTYAVTAVRQ